MNSVPIVTVNDLAADSFTANKKGIDLKLSSANRNGLKLTPGGLTYSAGGGNSANPRVLLGAFEGTSFKDYNFNNEVDINLNVQSLGSDGDYLYLGLESDHELALSTHSHQDATTYGQEVNGTRYGNSFPSISWDNQSQQQTISYSVGGVTRTLMLSYVRLNKVFYVWCDIVCIEPANFIGLDSGNQSGDGITFNGKSYSEFYVDATYNLNLVAISAFDDEAGGYDYYLSQVGPYGLTSPLFSFPRMENRYPITQKYNYAADLLAVVHNDGSVLKIIDGRDVTSVSFATGKEDAHCAIDIYPDPNSTDVLVAVAYGDNNVVVVYRYSTDARTITIEKSYNVDFNTYQQGSNYYFIMALKVISATHIGFALFLGMPNGEYPSKMMVVNTETSEVVEEHPMLNSNIYSGVENLNWLIDKDHSTNKVHIYELTETGINPILEHQLTAPGYAALFKAADKRAEAVGADRFPGVVFNDWDNTVFVALTPYVVDGVPTLHVQTATSEKPLDSYNDHLGYGEALLASPVFIAAIDKSLKAVMIELTLVN